MKILHFTLIKILLIWITIVFFYGTLHGQTVIINTNSIWKYIDTGSNLGANWNSTTFNDAAWPLGRSELGYGDAPVTTLIPSQLGYYFRKVVTIANPSLYSNLTMKMRRDDGIVVYVNNVEVYRNNMPSGTINYNTKASAACSDDGNTISTITLSNTLFQPGDNLVAAEVHNNSTSSSDLTFELQLIGNPAATVACAVPNSNLFGNRNVTSTTAEVFWMPVSAVQSYNVAYRIRLSGANYSTSIATSTASITLINLLPSTNYEFIVQSNCTAGGASSFSSSGWITTFAGTGSPPACGFPNENTFGSRNSTSTSVEVYWSPVAGVPSYNVAYRIRSVGAAYSSSVTTNTAFLSLINLIPTTNYEFIVQSNCPGGGVSAFSPSGWITTPAGTGPPPACGIPDANTFVNSNISTTSANISWTSIPGVQSYNVEYRILNSGANYSSPPNVTTNSVALTNLQPSTVYEFIIQSVCAGNTLSAFSSGSSFSTLPSQAGTCAIPDINNFGTRNKTSSSAEVFWNAVSGAISYNVEYRIRNSGAGYSTPISSTSTSLVLTSLVSSQNYEFIVQSVCSGNTLTAYSPSGWFTTLASGGTSTTLVRGPYMPVVTSNSITIQWRTSTATNNEVKYGTSSTLLNNTATNTSVSTEHSIALTGLQPNTKYFYSIGTVGVVLQGDATNYFYTAPIDGSTQAVKFWVTGDFGNGSAQQLAVRNSFTNYTSGQAVNGWLWLGDNAYSSGTDAEYQSKVFNVYNSQFKNIPVFPAPGNHDYAQSGYQSAASLGVNFPYFDIFALPATAGTEKYYSTNYANIHFISLDSYGSYNSSSSPMYDWLSNDLANNTQQWTIVYFHHPPYSKGSHDSDTESELRDMRTNITPLLESYGVDLVLSGHSHSYERTNFIKNHTGLENTFNSAIYPTGNIIQAGAGPYIKTSRTGNGTIYMVCGVSGQNNGATTPGFPHNAMFKSIMTSNGSLLIDVIGGNLTCKFLSSSGIVEDEFSIQKPANALLSTSRNSQPKTELETEPIIYPNPSTGDVNIRINNRDNIQFTVSIVNTSGNIFFKKFYTAENAATLLIEKSESNLSPGIYMINISGGNINTTRRLVIY